MKKNLFLHVFYYIPLKAGYLHPWAEVVAAATAATAIASCNSSHTLFH